jgi:hypothetical protein
VNRADPSPASRGERWCPPNRPPGRNHSKFTLGAPIAALCLVAAALSGCHSPPPGVSNGSVSACYRAIPIAKAAVHDVHATLIGVHRIPADTVKHRLPPSAQVELANEDDTVVCAVSFKGSFAAGQVNLAPPSERGSYAVVLLTSRRLHLVGSVVLSSLPKSLGGRTV